MTDFFGVLDDFVIDDFSSPDEDDDGLNDVVYYDDTEYDTSAGESTDG